MTTQCLICEKPLGQESKDQGFMFCHEHRKCPTCESDLSAREQQWCLDRYQEKLDLGAVTNYQDIEVICARCDISKRASGDAIRTITQSEYDRINIARLMVTPDIALSTITNANNARIQNTKLIGFMDYEHKLQHLEMLQACVANTVTLIKQDPAYRKGSSIEKEKQRVSVAHQEALTSSRPSTKTATDFKEIELGKFMKTWSLQDRKSALKILKKIDENIAHWEAVGVDKETAKNMSIEALVKSGVLKK